MTSTRHKCHDMSRNLSCYAPGTVGRTLHLGICHYFRKQKGFKIFSFLSELWQSDNKNQLTIRHELWVSLISHGLGFHTLLPEKNKQKPFFQNEKYWPRDSCLQTLNQTNMRRHSNSIFLKPPTPPLTVNWEYPGRSQEATVLVKTIILSL